MQRFLKKLNPLQSLQTIVARGFRPQEYFLKTPIIAAHCYIAILDKERFLKSKPIAAHCTPFLQNNFGQGSSSSKVLSLQPNLNSQFWTGDISSTVKPLQPTVDLSRKGVLARGDIRQKSYHCRQHLHGNFGQWEVSQKTNRLQPIADHCSPRLHRSFGQAKYSSNVNTLQPIAEHSRKRIVDRGVTPKKSYHCSPL